MWYEPTLKDMNRENGGSVGNIRMDRQKALQDYLFRWVRLGQMGVTIEELLKKRELSRIAIYGYDKIAECLVYELKSGLVQVECIIDRKGKGILTDFPTVTLQDIKPLNLDAIIICPVDDYGNIKKDIEKICDVPLITFEELIYEL